MHGHSRRRFLAAMAATAGCLGMRDLAMPGRCSSAQTTAPWIGLGFSLYGMRNLKIAEALEACRQIGYDGVELVLIKGWATDPAETPVAERREIRSRLQGLGLSLPAMMENLSVLADEATHRANLERIQLAAEMGQTLSPDRPPVLETILGGKPEEWDRDKGEIVERLQAWANAAHTTGIVIAIKPHVAGAVHLPQQAAWLCQQVASPQLKAVFDYSHYELRGLSLNESLTALAKEVAFVHVKDANGDAGKFKFLLPGEGRTDYVQVAKQLMAIGYRGYVVVEVSAQIHGRPGYDGIDAARRSYAALAPAWQTAGASRKG